MAEMTDDPPPPIFRAAKRRKVLRKRVEDDPEVVPQVDAEDGPQETQVMTQTSSLGEDGTSAANIAEILRKRKLGKSRRAGIEFSNSAQSSTPRTPQPNALAHGEPEMTALELAAGRFTRQTGLVADTQDKHMMAYVDSKLAELRSGATDEQSDHADALVQHTSETNGNTRAVQERQAARFGKLQEVDLGPSTTLHNIERTEAAKKRLETGEPFRVDEQDKPKYWRGRRRRNSDDIRRDQLVEEVMRESRLEIYDEPEPAQAEDEQAADDRIAEKFKQEFLDAIKHNHVRRSAPAPPGGNKAKDERPKGPKLGGSRNARAAMKAMEEAAKKK